MRRPLRDVHGDVAAPWDARLLVYAIVDGPHRERGTHGLLVQLARRRWAVLWSNGDIDDASRRPSGWHIEVDGVWHRTAVWSTSGKEARRLLEEYETRTRRDIQKDPMWFDGKAPETHLVPDDDDARRMDPQIGDTIRVRPWDKVRERDVIGRGFDINGPYVRFFDHYPERVPGQQGVRTHMTLEMWQRDAAHSLMMTEKEAEGHRRLDEAFTVLGRAERLARKDGNHCLSCVETEAEQQRYWQRAMDGEDAEPADEEEP